MYSPSIKHVSLDLTATSGESTQQNLETSAEKIQICGLRPLFDIRAVYLKRLDESYPKSSRTSSLAFVYHEETRKCS